MSDLAAAVRKLISDVPLRIALDAVGSADAQHAGYDAVSSGGQVVTLLPVEGEYPVEDDKRVFFVLGSVHPLGPHRDLGKLVFENLPRLLEDGVIKVCWFCAWFDRGNGY